MPFRNLTATGTSGAHNTEAILGELVDNASQRASTMPVRKRGALYWHAYWHALALVEDTIGPRLTPAVRTIAMLYFHFRYCSM